MIICADDYGLNPSINSAILDLARQNKINAASVLINKADSNSLKDLLQLSDKVEIGLHLDLGKIKPQIDLFYKAFGFYPNYYDGHRHCHIYPFIGHRLINEIKKLPPHRFYIRSLNISPEIKQTRNIFNKLYIAILSVCNNNFIKLLKNNSIATNAHLYGSFNNHMSIEKIFELYKKRNGKNDLLFFHPSIKQEKCKIPRKYEYEYIKKSEVI